MGGVVGIMIALLAIGVGAVLSAPTGPRVAAHRGGAHLWPENSLGAFRRALALGVDFIETDVHLSGDGDVVAIHDATLDRTTTATGAVRKATAAMLAAARLRDRAGAVTDEPVPSLAALLALLQPSRAGVLVEIKVDERGIRYPAIEEKVVGLVRAHDLAARTVVMAFEPATLARLREVDPALRTVLLVGSPLARRRHAAASVHRATELGTWGIGFHHRLVDAESVAASRAAGLAVAAWTVNDPIDLHRVLEAHPDVVISDRPDLALRELGR
jgi:glycerophosphoryl diester phosphodiesterase